ncbi:hypothetical protein D9M68_672350 [compost metagenome]
MPGATPSSLPIRTMLTSVRDSDWAILMAHSTIASRETSRPLLGRRPTRLRVAASGTAAASVGSVIGLPYDLIDTPSDYRLIFPAPTTRQLG